MRLPAYRCLLVVAGAGLHLPSNLDGESILGAGHRAVHERVEDILDGTVGAV